MLEVLENLTLNVRICFLAGSVVKNLPANAEGKRDESSVPGLERFPGEGNGNPLPYCCLENPVNRGAWWSTVHSVAKEWDMTEQLNQTSFPKC